MNNTHSHIQHTAHKKNPSQDIKNRAQSAELAYAKLIGEPALLPLIIRTSPHGSIKQYFVQKREQNKQKVLYTRNTNTLTLNDSKRYGNTIP